MILEMNYVSDVEGTERGVQSVMGGHWWGEYQKSFLELELTWNLIVIAA